MALFANNRLVTKEIIFYFKTGLITPNALGLREKNTEHLKVKGSSHLLLRHDLLYVVCTLTKHWDYGFCG